MDNPQAKAPAKSKFIAETGINHDGRDYLVGDEIELTDAQAKALGRDVSTPDAASRDAQDAPKARKKEADERESAAARAEYDRAKTESDDADAALKEATAKAQDLQKRAQAAQARLAKIKQPKGEGPHTWEQDADKLGGGQLTPVGAVGAAGRPAQAPPQGSAMTPSTPTAEAVKK